MKQIAYTGRWLCLVLVLLQGIPALLHAQQQPLSYYGTLKEKAEIIYGPPVELLSGIKYYYPYGNAVGDPYLGTDGEGSLLTGGTVYDHLKLKYDIYNQLLVLEYRDRAHALVSIVVGNGTIDAFTIGNKHFRKYRIQNGEMRFGQVIFEGRFNCLYLWKKTYAPEFGNSTGRYAFSDPVRTGYIMEDQHFVPFHGRRSFLHAFPDELRTPVKRILKERRIRIRKASDREMHDAMEQINQLEGTYE